MVIDDLIRRSDTRRNLKPEALVQQALERDEGRLTDAGALAVLTIPHTGRSPQDKFIVADEATSDAVWWSDKGGPNKPFTPAQFTALEARVINHLAAQDLYQQDLAAGASTEARISLRVFTPNAWHALFARNMFVRPDAPAEIPDFTILHAPEFKADPSRDGTRSDCFVILNFTKGTILIGGTRYAGEIKKSIFTVMNWLLPARGMLPMHCSANIGPNGPNGGDSALFFGLSGTGKTTLSADPARRLIGDDEHGWSDAGIFNFEGGCYAKAINLSAEAEPQIFAACQQSGTVLENVVVDAGGAVDYADASYAENTRACYPLDFIDNAEPSGAGGQPKNIVFLTCDAFGVLPPISKLTREQAMYHFLSGYTARVAGTEQGVTEPTATFSACFAAPFLPRPPQVYAKLLGDKMDLHKANCWLLNTGWAGGKYGVGERMPIGLTRNLLHAALSGTLDKANYEIEPFFGLAVPQLDLGDDSDLMNPRDAWADKAAYDKTARHVASLFDENYKKFS